MNPFPTLVIAATLMLTGCSSSDDNDDSVPTPDENADETSEPAPGGDDQEPISNTPGGDTSAVAGYWDGTNGGDNERYFVIADNGLWTEYFLAVEGDTVGNCYYISGPQTLTPEDPSTNAYSLADGQALALTSDEARNNLTVEYIVEERETEVWPAVVGRVPEDLPLCQE